MKTKPLSRFRPRSIPKGMLITRTGMPPATVRTDAEVRSAPGNCHEADAAGHKFATSPCDIPRSIGMRDHSRRVLLLQLDASIRGLRARAPESPEIIPLASCYRSLLRMWGDV